jgi:PQQ enzyme repeat
VYAQPLYWVPPTGTGAERLIVATEQNFVYALDASTGKQIWAKSLGAPVPLSKLPCGNINPMGVTGTPVIDPVAAIVYLEAFVETVSGARHYVFGLSLATGAIASGWPVDIGKGLAALHHSFDETPQGQRSALALINGKLYVPYAGHYGDCGVYNGIVVGLNTAKPAVFGSGRPKPKAAAVGGRAASLSTARRCT